MPYYRHLLNGGPKTVVSGKLTSVQVMGRKHIYTIGERAISVWIPLGKKQFKQTGYLFSGFDSLLNVTIALHFIPLPGGKSILLKTVFPAFPGKQRKCPVTRRDRQILEKTARTVAGFSSKAIYVFLAIVFILISVLAQGNMFIWGTMTALLILIGLLIQSLIYCNNKRTRQWFATIQEKTEVTGIVTQTGTIKYQTSPVYRVNYTLIMVGGKWYVLAGKIALQCAEKVHFSFAGATVKGRNVPVQLIGELKHISAL